MARFINSLQWAETALAAATAKTLITIQPAANCYAALLAWGVYFDGVAPTAEPVQVELLRFTAATAGTYSTGTVVKWNDALPATVQTTARYAYTVDPTNAADIIWSGEVHPQTWYEIMYPFGQEPIVGGSNANMKLGIRATAPANVNSRGYLRWED